MINTSVNIQWSSVVQRNMMITSQWTLGEETMLRILWTSQWTFAEVHLLRIFTIFSEHSLKFSCSEYCEHLSEHALKFSSEYYEHLSEHSLKFTCSEYYKHLGEHAPKFSCSEWYEEHQRTFGEIHRFAVARIASERCLNNIWFLLNRNVNGTGLYNRKKKIWNPLSDKWKWCFIFQWSRKANFNRKLMFLTSIIGYF